MPILHLSSHGSEKGIHLTSGELVTWTDLGEMLSPLHEASNGAYLLCVSTCMGLHAIRMALTSAKAPLFGVVGTFRVVPWEANVVGFCSFYHLLRMGKTIRQAVEGMKAASGYNDYEFGHGPSFLNAYIESVTPPRLPR